MKDIPTQIDGATSLPAADFNQIPDELENLITKAGLTLDGLDLDQVSRAISIYSAGGAFYTDSGVVDAYVLSPVGTKLAPESYFDGMKIGFFLTTPNTGAATVNVNSIGVKNIVDPVGGPLTGGELDDYVEAIYILSSDHFRLIETVSAPDASTTTKGIIEIATQTEVDTGTDSERAIVPSTLANSPQVSTAWVNFDGTGTVTIRDSFNISSIADNGTGNYTANYTNNLTVDVCTQVTVGAGNLTACIGSGPTVSGVNMRAHQAGTATAIDVSYCFIAVFGGI